jgi:uncharacterized membrane protein
VTFAGLMEGAVLLFEVAGVTILIVGSLLTVIAAGRLVLDGHRIRAYEVARQGIGRAVLLGLEILIIADIIQTVIIDPTLESAATLGLIVLVRIVLSFSLEIELEGQLPWRMRASPKQGATETSGAPGAIRD